MTKFYLRATTSGLPSGTLPTAEQSSLTSADNFEADQTTNRLLSTTKGGGQTSLANASLAQTSATNYYVARWVSPMLKCTSITANTWNYNFAANESNLLANFPVSGASQPVRVNCYVWKPSNGTKYGTILDGNTASSYSETGTAGLEQAMHGTFTGSAVSSLTSSDACLVFEMWFVITQGMTTSYTQTVYFDGTVENTTPNATVSDHAAYIETPQDFTDPAVSSTNPVNTAVDVLENATIQVVFSKAMGSSTINTTNITVIDDTSTTVAGTWSLAGDNVTATFTPSANMPNSKVITVTLSTSVTDSTGIPLPSSYVFSFTTIAASGPSTKIPHIVNAAAFATSLGTGANEYLQCGISAFTGFNTTEANRSIIYRTAGTLTKLCVNVTSNAITASSTVVLRKNTADGALSVSIPLSTTGLFEDTSNSETASAGDKFSYKFAPGATGSVMGLRYVSMIFKASDAAMSKLVNAGSMATSTASSTSYQSITGNNANLTNAVEQVARADIAGTIKNLAIYISANTRTASTCLIRKNNADTSVSVSITASTTGLFEDISNTSSVAATDTLSYKFVTGTGTNSITAQYIASEFVNSTNNGFLPGVSETTSTINFNRTEYGLFGALGFSVGTIEGAAQEKFEEAFTLSNLTAHISTNTLDNSTTIRTRVAAANGNQSLSIGTATTGYFTDSTHTDVLTAGTLANGQIVTTGTVGSIILDQVAIWTYIRGTPSAGPFVAQTVFIEWEES